jgi:hypothetical protein
MNKIFNLIKQFEALTIMKKNSKSIFVSSFLWVVALTGFSLQAISSESEQLTVSSINATHFPEIDVPIAKHISSLKASTNGGDAKAACRLGFELERCGVAAALEDSAARFERLIATMDANDARKSGRVALANNVRKQADLAKRVCNNVSKKDAADGWKYTLLAAKKGHQQTAIRYVMQINAGLDFADLTQSTDAWLAYKENAPVFLSDAIANGSSQAYEYAAFNHLKESANWRLLPFDPIKGVAYYEALKIHASTRYKEVLDRHIEYSIRTKKLSASELEQARKLSHELAIKLTDIPVGGIDHVYGVAPSEDAQYCNLR